MCVCVQVGANGVIAIAMICAHLMQILIDAVICSKWANLHSPDELLKLSSHNGAANNGKNYNNNKTRDSDSDSKSNKNNNNTIKSGKLMLVNVNMKA